MNKRIISVGYAIVAMLLLITLWSGFATAAEQLTATSAPAPTTLGTVTEHTGPSVFFVLAGVLIIAAAGVAIFMRYKR